MELGLREWLFVEDSDGVNEVQVVERVGEKRILAVHVELNVLCCRVREWEMVKENEQEHVSVLENECVANSDNVPDEETVKDEKLRLRVQVFSRSDDTENVLEKVVEAEAEQLVKERVCVRLLV